MCITNESKELIIVLQGINKMIPIARRKFDIQINVFDQPCVYCLQSFMMCNLDIMYRFWPGFGLGTGVWDAVGLRRCSDHQDLGHTDGKESPG